MPFRFYIGNSAPGPEDPLAQNTVLTIRLKDEFEILFPNDATETDRVIILEDAFNHQQRQQREEFFREARNLIIRGGLRMNTNYIPNPNPQQICLTPNPDEGVRPFVYTPGMTHDIADEIGAQIDVHPEWRRFSERVLGVPHRSVSLAASAATSSCILPTPPPPPPLAMRSESFIALEKERAVHEKAWQLLSEKIGKDKYEHFMVHGFFDEQGREGIYRFNHYDDMNNPGGAVCLIKSLKLGGRSIETTYRLCIQSKVAGMPKGDVILSRWMMLKADEDEFLKIANFRSAAIADEAHNPVREIPPPPDFHQRSPLEETVRSLSESAGRTLDRLLSAALRTASSAD